MVAKDSPRIEAYGTVDELNAILGLVRKANHDEAGPDAAKARIDAILQRAQNELFNLGSLLATLPEDLSDQQPRIEARHVEALEHDIDELNEHLPPLRSFTLPGGGWVSSYLHLARTVCRRAERVVVQPGRARAGRRRVRPLRESPLRCALRDRSLERARARRDRAAVDARDDLTRLSRRGRCDRRRVRSRTAPDCSDRGRCSSHSRRTWSSSLRIALEACRSRPGLAAAPHYRRADRRQQPLAVHRSPCSSLPTPIELPVSPGWPHTELTDRSPPLDIDIDRSGAAAGEPESPQPTRRAPPAMRDTRMPPS